MVAMMLVLRGTTGSESMSSRHRCSRKVSAMAAGSCCRWKKELPSSWVIWAALARRRYPAGPAVERGCMGTCLWSPSFRLSALSIPSLSSPVFVESYELGIMHILSYLVTRMLVSRYCYMLCNYPHLLGKETEAEKG